MKDISKLHNPYDFANPVSDESLFFGRQTELEEIRYYLDLAANVLKPISLAILGPRASGKTSLLNMTEQTGQKMNFCTVRVNLDEGDVLNEMRFFHKLFNSVLTSACRCGAFGGISGKTYDTYLDMISSYTIPQDPDRKFCPFIFPISYAKAMAVGNSSMPLLDFAYTDDLRRIAEALARPILILFDEGNVLAKSRVHLEKMRNIFMNLSRFMIVIAGTADLFPIMDEVFSPMVRQFKRIVVGEFKSEDDTDRCVREPLRKLGLPYSQTAKIAPPNSVDEIHELSGGRPYEVQLICHVLFRRLQSGRAGKMSLDVSSLDEIRKELETSQSLNKRPLLSRIRSLDKTELAALTWFFMGTGSDFESLWSIEYFLDHDQVWKKDDLLRHLDAFAREGILRQDGGILHFEGDDFERLYTRYLARERGARPTRIVINVLSSPPELMATIRITIAIGHRARLQFLTLAGEAEELSNISKVADSLSDPSSEKDVFVEYPEAARQLYFAMLVYRNCQHIPMLEVSITLPGCRVSNLYFASDPAGSERVGSALNDLEDFRQRAKEVGGDCYIGRGTLNVAPMEQLLLKRERTANRSMRQAIIQQQIAVMARAYSDDRKSAESLFYADLAYKDLADLTASGCNNLGYVFFSSGDVSRARFLFEEAIRRREKAPGDNDSTMAVLAIYNLAMIEIRSNELLKAAGLLKECRDQMLAGNQEMECRCLFIPKNNNGVIILEETFENPELSEMANLALTVISEVLQ